MEDRTGTQDMGSSGTVWALKGTMQSQKNHGYNSCGDLLPQIIVSLSINMTTNTYLDFLSSALNDEECESI